MPDMVDQSLGPVENRRLGSITAYSDPTSKKSENTSKFPIAGPHEPDTLSVLECPGFSQSETPNRPNP